MSEFIHRAALLVRFILDHKSGEMIIRRDDGKKVRITWCEARTKLTPGVVKAKSVQEYDRTGEQGFELNQFPDSQ